ncbi:hypothetical protein [Polymorphospora rubra]|uniref:Uncharacterized protein n=1 Tax=Polymorphospora rubra TaxID=338584 RepID=A0A810MS59_9ACTN|nr:hypothetical protein [Polymorphospora rubra]BCJ63881.1 hypothetical protein Prubr_09020 [Polymorphospora rubra]
MAGTGHGLVAGSDGTAFLARLTRLDRAAVVRLRPGRTGDGPAVTALWAWLPWSVLVTRVVAGAAPGDATVLAADLLAELGRGGGDLPARCDARWLWPLPPPASRVVETMAGADVRRVADAAAGTLRTASTDGVGGRAVGQRALRDALLDHVAVVVEPEPADGAGSGRVEVPQRLVQAVVRMGFLGSGDTAPDSPVRVRLAGRWIGLAAPFGTAWLPPVQQFAISPTKHRPKV